jgi:hypothetical protein
MKTWAKYLLLSLWLTIAFASAKAAEDSLAKNNVSQPATPQISLPPRNFDPQKIQEYRQDRQYSYDREIVEVESLWDKIKMWFLRKIYRLFFDDTVSGLWLFLRYAFIALVLGYVLYKARYIDFRALFSPPPKNMPISYGLVNENIHAINFDEQINAAVQQQMYSRAIRLYYLKTLKVLNDNELLEWRKEKTNLDYVREMQKNMQNATEFSELTKLFEYVYYGDFAINKTSFEQMQSSFTDFIKQIAPQRK